MKSVTATAASSLALVAVGFAAYVGADANAAQSPVLRAVTSPRPTVPRPARPHEPVTRRAPSISNEALTAVVKGTCGTCHSRTQKSGNLVLANFDVAAAARTPRRPRR